MSHRPRPVLDRADYVLALGLTAVATILYLSTAHPDWTFDPLRYADWTQRGEVDRLFLPSHLLGNLIPLGVFEGLRAFGYRGGSLPVLTVVSAIGAAATVGMTYLVGRRLSSRRLFPREGRGPVVDDEAPWSPGEWRTRWWWSSRLPPIAAAAVLAVTLGVWRAGGSAGVYGVALFTVALAWLAAARYTERPGALRAAVLGAAVVLAIGGSRASVAFLPAALVLVIGFGGASEDRPAVGWLRTLGGFAAGGIIALLPMVAAAGLKAGWSPSDVVGQLADWAGKAKTAGLFSIQQVEFDIDRLASGVAGFTVLPFPLGIVTPALGRILITVGLLTLVVGRGLTLLVRPGRATVVGAALFAHAGLTMLLAFWYEAGRGDHFALALVPLALLWSAGGRGPARLRVPMEYRAVGAVAVVGGLLTWNLVGAALPGVERWHTTREGAAVVQANAPRSARLVLSPQVAPQLVYLGLDAQTGWSLLLEAFRVGGPIAGVPTVVERERGRPFLISSRAFDLSADQVDLLGDITVDAIWANIRECCRPKPAFALTTSAGREVVYRLRTPRPS